VKQQGVEREVACRGCSQNQADPPLAEVQRQHGQRREAQLPDRPLGEAEADEYVR
jgi:hypothetical protein